MKKYYKLVALCYSGLQRAWRVLANGAGKLSVMRSDRLVKSEITTNRASSRMMRITAGLSFPLTRAKRH